jgi:hypothetical protein
MDPEIYIKMLEKVKDAEDGTISRSAALEHVESNLTALRHDLQVWNPLANFDDLTQRMDTIIIIALNFKTTSKPECAIPDDKKSAPYFMS